MDKRTHVRYDKSSKPAGDGNSNAEGCGDALSRVVQATSAAIRENDHLAGQAHEMRDHAIVTARNLRKDLRESDGGPREEAQQDNYQRAVQSRALADSLIGTLGQHRQRLSRGGQ